MDVISVLSLSHSFRGDLDEPDLGDAFLALIFCQSVTIQWVQFPSTLTKSVVIGGVMVVGLPSLAGPPPGNMFILIHALHKSVLSPRLPTEEWWSMSGTGDLKRTRGIGRLTWFDHCSQHGNVSSSVLATVQVTWWQFNHLCSHCCSTPLVFNPGVHTLMFYILKVNYVVLEKIKLRMWYFTIVTR